MSLSDFLFPPLIVESFSLDYLLERFLKQLLNHVEIVYLFISFGVRGTKNKQLFSVNLKGCKYPLLNIQLHMDHLLLATHLTRYVEKLSKGKQ